MNLRHNTYTAVVVPAMSTYQTPAIPDDALPRLLRAWLAGKAENTINAYRTDLEAFVRWAGADSFLDVLRQWHIEGAGRANEDVLNFRDYLAQDRHLASSTVNRNIASIKSLVGAANLIGLLTFTIRVPQLRQSKPRNVAGPAQDAIATLAVFLASRCNDPRAQRDLALLRLLYDVGLRVGSVVGLDVEHIDGPNRTALFTLKGKRDREPFGLANSTAQALLTWVGTRNALLDNATGPVFVALDRTGMNTGHRLSTVSVRKMLRARCKAAGVPAFRPHGLRHACATTIKNASNGNTTLVSAALAHEDLRSASRYFDDRANDQRRGTEMAAESLDASIMATRKNGAGLPTR